MQHGARFVVWAGAALLFASCAGVSHVPIPDERADQRSQGIRYYRHSLYLLVRSDGMGGLNTTWEFLPDRHKKMSICSHNFVSSIESTYDFEHGVLTSSSETPDSSEVPAAVLQAAASVLPVIAGLMAKGGTEPDHEVPPPQIFKVVAEGDQVVFVGHPHRFFGDGTVQPIDVSIVPLPPKNEP